MADYIGLGFWGKLFWTFPFLGFEFTSAGECAMVEFFLVMRWSQKKTRLKMKRLQIVTSKMRCMEKWCGTTEPTSLRPLAYTFIKDIYQSHSRVVVPGVVSWSSGSSKWIHLRSVNVQVSILTIRISCLFPFNSSYVYIVYPMHCDVQHTSISNRKINHPRPIFLKYNVTNPITNTLTYWASPNIANKRYIILRI